MGEAEEFVIGQIHDASDDEISSLENRPYCVQTTQRS